MEVKHESNLFENLSKCPIFTTHKCDGDNNFKLSYLEYVVIDNDKDDNDNSTYSEGPFDRNIESTQKLGLKIKVLEGYLDKLTIDPDIDSTTPDEHIISRGVECIINEAFLNSKAYNNKTNTNIFEVDLSQLAKVDPARKIITKIISISNLISIEGRRGPATYAIVTKDIYDLIELGFTSKNKSLYVPGELNIAGIKLLCSDMLQDDTFVVGRKPLAEEPGFHCVTAPEKLAKYFLDIDGKMLSASMYKLVLMGDTRHSAFGCTIKR